MWEPSKELLELVQRIKELKGKGISSGRVAEMLGVSRHRVNYIVACFELSKPGYRRKLNRDVCFKVASDYAEGRDIAEIASAYNLSPHTIVGLVKALCVHRRRRKRRVDVEALRELFQRGLSDKEIAEHFNVSARYIGLLRHRLGLRRKPEVPLKLRLLDTLVKLLEEHGVIDSVDFYNATGRRLGIGLIRLALQRGLPIGYAKITGTSSVKLWVFPRGYHGMFIVYKKGCEEEAVDRLLSMANPRIPMKAVRGRVVGTLLEHIPSTGLVGHYKSFTQVSSSSVGACP